MDENENAIRPSCVEVIKKVTKKIKHRKRHLSWEEADMQSKGTYFHSLVEISGQFPTLSMMELKISVLIRVMKSSWEIAEILGVSEHTVENHRVNIRKKVAAKKGNNLLSCLLQVN